MNKTKVIILVAIVIAIFVGIYLSISSSSSSSERNIVITILDNQGLDTYSNQVIDNTINEIMINNPTEINISILTTSNNNKRKTTLRMKPNEAEMQWENEIRTTLKKLLKGSVVTSPTNQSTNDLVIQTIQRMKDNGNDAGNYYILTGSFPECYDNESSSTLKNKIIELTKGFHTKSKIIWCVFDTRKNEYEIFKTLQTSNICPFVDSRVIAEKSRECPEINAQNIYGIFFDKLKEDQAREFFNYLKNKFGENIKLTIWNDSPHNNEIINLYKKDSLNDYIKLLGKLEKGKWTSIGYLLKQASNNFLQLNDSLTRNLMIIGNLPLEGTGNQLDRPTWQLLKDIKNLSITLYKPMGVKDNKTDKAFKDGFKYYKIDYKTN
jgi:hypothetical protein